MPLVALARCLTGDGILVGRWLAATCVLIQLSLGAQRPSHWAVSPGAAGLCSKQRRHQNFPPVVSLTWCSLRSTATASFAGAGGFFAWAAGLSRLGSSVRIFTILF